MPDEYERQTWTKWESWYAWHPVITYDEGVKWLSVVGRRSTRIVEPGGFINDVYYEYCSRRMLLIKRIIEYDSNK